MSPLLAAALALLFSALVLTAALKDLTSFTIPNWISLALLAAFPVAALAAGMPLLAVGQNVGVGVAALLGGMAMFALGWLGGGDAKLFAAVALWLGWPAVGPFLAVTALCGGGLAVILLMLRAPACRPLATMGPAWFAKLAQPGESAPYGVAIACGALAAFPQTLFATGLGL